MHIILDTIVNGTYCLGRLEEVDAIIIGRGNRSDSDL